MTGSTIADSFTWGDWCRLHPLSEYRDAEWQEWRNESARECQQLGISFIWRNPVPAMEAVEAMSLGLKVHWEGPWLAQQDAAWCKAIGEPSREETRVFQAQADRASRELMRERCFDIDWVQANL
jgi:hypothetical protein